MSRNEIIVGLDDSPSARAALQWAAQHALQDDTVLRAINVLDLPYGMSSVGWDDIPRLTQNEIESAHRSRMTNVFKLVDLPPDWSMEFVRGDAGPVLVRESQQAKLGVVRTREHVGIGRLLAGSVSHYCLSHAPCPVVAVPAEAGSAVSGDRDPADQVGVQGQANAS
jgi:nucleotide-binding universal stress UspA family protein